MTANLSAALKQDLAAKIPRTGFEQTSVLVVGDLMLDRYISGEVTRISPEAPVPVLSVRGKRGVAGGAANVALNVAGLRAQAFIGGVIGDDAHGSRLCELLEEKGVSIQALIRTRLKPTTCKTRVVCDNHQIVRFDEEDAEEIPPSVSNELFEKVVERLERGIQAVLLSDYAKGVLTIPLTKAIMRACEQRHIPVFIDPKRADYSTYSGATCITPNQREFKAAIHTLAISETGMAAAGSVLLRRLACGFLLVTQGANGMTLLTPDQSHHFPALAEEIFDVSGAGDTVISTLATGVAAGLDFVAAVQLSNIAAGVVVRHAGTTPVSWGELQNLLFPEAAVPGLLPEGEAQASARLLRNGNPVLVG